MFPTFLEATQRGKTSEARQFAQYPRPTQNGVQHMFFSEKKGTSRQASNSVLLGVFFKHSVHVTIISKNFPFPLYPPQSPPLSGPSRGSNGPSPMGIHARWDVQTYPSVRTNQYICWDRVRFPRKRASKRARACHPSLALTRPESQTLKN